MDSGNCPGSSSPCAMRRSRSTAGASILLALFFILFCGVVAVVVLRFAAVNGERTAEHAREENTYYAVTSAEGLVEDTFASNITGGDTPPRLAVCRWGRLGGSRHLDGLHGAG